MDFHELRVLHHGAVWSLSAGHYCEVSLKTTLPIMILNLLQKEIDFSVAETVTATKYVTDPQMNCLHLFSEGVSQQLVNK